MEIKFRLPSWPKHWAETFITAMVDKTEDGTLRSKTRIYNGVDSEGVIQWTNWQLTNIEDNTFTVECPDQEGFITELINFFVRQGLDQAKEKYDIGYKEGQERQFSQKTEMEQFVSLVNNVNVYDLNALAKDNEFIIQDLLHDLPGVIRKLDELLSKAKLSVPIEGTIKPTKIEAGSEIIFFYERRLERKARRMLIGLNEQKQRISLEYAWLYNCTWIEGRQYVIKNLGLVEGRRRRDPSYYSFEIKEINEADQLI